MAETLPNPDQSSVGGEPGPDANNPTVLRTLDQLPLGVPATVTKLTGTSAIRRRLMEMGLTAKSIVVAVRRAPLGDPIDVKVRGYHLSLRKEEAAAVEVTVDPRALEPIANTPKM